jgi:hypothetical protein
MQLVMEVASLASVNFKGLGISPPENNGAYEVLNTADTESVGLIETLRGANGSPISKLITTARMPQHGNSFSN